MKPDITVLRARIARKKARHESTARDEELLRQAINAKLRAEVKAARRVIVQSAQKVAA